MLLGAPCFAFGLVTAAAELAKPTPPESAPATSLVWAGRVFPEKRDFAAWLEARGVRYKDWALAHPAARSVFEPSSGLADTSAHAESPQKGLAIGIVVASALGLLLLLATLLFKSLRPVARHRRPRAAPRPGARLPRPALRGIRIPELGTFARWSTVRGGLTALGHSLASTAGSAAASLRAPRLAKPRAALRGVRSSAVEYETGTVEYEEMFPRRMLHHLMPDLVWYGSSILLALVIGASIALYLR